MPLTLAKPGVENIIKKVGGNNNIKQFLNSLGITIGGNIKVVAENNGNIIVKVKDSRIAISREMANKIII